MQPTSTATPTRLQEFDYELPPERIAKYPLAERDQAKMMLINRQAKAIDDRRFYELPDILEPGDLVVVNNAKVIPARLDGRRKGFTGHVELFLMYPQNAERTQWQVLMRPARRLKPGTEVEFGDTDLKAVIVERYEDGRGLVELSWPSQQTFEEMLSTIGKMPIPPYLERPAEALDNERYQTVFARVEGAQAAPTAGLHFTDAIFTRLKAKGIGLAEITLHVSAGTFRPVLHDEIHKHQMDPEYYEVGEEAAQAIQATKAAGKRIVAIGTTVAKTLETVAQKHHGQIVASSDWSNLYITPGFQFQAINMMLTNFHLPKSTLLMMICAFADHELIMRAYNHAVATDYRFYSYGDCMLIQ